ncbi:hypothetical protein A7A08_02494 [Methyloligella halotolerans]|uniref:Phosphodiester glycosidase domain-containing protein n=1 Tax=Methyloligella halotolerans TaxID=1177755 RepID=A0A1E2RWT3_9HYPH|nr:phosphodiester glycosidase family protein [Methyloligella halotolerans]ODA66726.1 hypothetical protein A7A08_02494 [Methyloligella halotolerans]
MRRPAKVTLSVLGCLLVAFLAVFIGIYMYWGWYGINVVLQRGGSQWVTVTKDDERLSPAMRLALQENPPPGEAGKLEWKEIAPGFEAGTLPVLVDGKEVDSFLLARIDAKRFKLVVRISPPGDNEVGDWMDELGAVMAVNGSYFAMDGWPDTPLVADGKRYGPEEYDATHGAFVAKGDEAHIVDLKDRDWQEVLEGADDAMVSYPLLVDRNGESRSKGDNRWLANRNFVAEDSEGRIIIGTTTDAFFSLNRLATFLANSPLDLDIALNLDGGPVACQAMQLNGFKRDFCGDWEIAVDDEEIKLLTPMIGQKRWTLPIVFAVMER